MKIEVTNLNIGETVTIDTDEWDETTEVQTYTTDDYLVVIHNNWKYLVKYEDFEAYVMTAVMLMRAVGCQLLERPLDTGISAGVYTMRGRAYRQYELPLFFIKIPGEDRASAQAVSTASLQCRFGGHYTVR